MRAALLTVVCLLLASCGLGEVGSSCEPPDHASCVDGAYCAQSGTCQLAPAAGGNGCDLDSNCATGLHCDNFRTCATVCGFCVPSQHCDITTQECADGAPCLGDGDCEQGACNDDGFCE